MKRLGMILLFLLALLPGVGRAVGLNNNIFRALPILHDGRVKPLESFARIYLMEISGANSLPGMSATDWLAECLFAPVRAMQHDVIRMDQAPIVQMLKLPPRRDHFYSYAEVTLAFEAQHGAVTAILQKLPEARSAAEKDFINRYQAVTDFFQLLNAMALVTPSHVTLTPRVAQEFNFSQEHPDALQLMAAGEQITARLNHIRRMRGNKIENYNADEKVIAQMAFYLANVQMVSADNYLFRVIPSAWDHGKTWYSPWELINGGYGAPQSVKLLKDWRQLAQAYVAQNPVAWQSASAAIQADTAAQNSIPHWKLALEVWYQILSPVAWAALVYGLAFLCLAFAAWRPYSLLKYGAGIFLGLAIAMHGALILSRVLILGRPPVSSLYESLLYVSFVLVLLGLWLARRRPESLIIAPLLSATILAISPVFAPAGDTMNVLIAVLNTNFWLATHVICITTGYGATLIAGMMAHLYLCRPRERMSALLRRLALFALLFTALGTMLGGIWADQSWGRFWGWDPKENGALMIVLWLIWILHGRLSRCMDDRAFAAWLGAANIMVALSWFGVNLLGVGLHSYGFTHAAAWGLGLFCGGEIVILTALYLLAGKSKVHAV